jgi:hypothetical protein
VTVRALAKDRILEEVSQLDRSLGRQDGRRRESLNTATIHLPRKPVLLPPKAHLVPGHDGLRTTPACLDKTELGEAYYKTNRTCKPRAFEDWATPTPGGFSCGMRVAIQTVSNLFFGLRYARGVSGHFF